jgi:hypothetical protein
MDRILIKVVSMKNKSGLFLLGAALISITGCDSVLKRSDLVNAQYWQRSNASSAIYLEGPKLQQMLQRDVAQCVTDVRELERLGAVHAAIPGEVEQPNLIVPDPNQPKGALELAETPRRDHYLYDEYYNYHDFETCMISKGWERTQYLPYDRANSARDQYIEAITGQHMRKTDQDNFDPPEKQPPQVGDYDDVNH